MSNQLTHRLNQILPKITSDDFLSGHGIGNEIAFYIFDYPPEDELRVREHIKFLLGHIPKQKPALRFIHINLFDFLIEYLESEDLLKESLALQKASGNTALLKALKGLLEEQEIAKRFDSVAKPQEHGLVLISGVGSAYPMIRSHTLLNNLHSIMAQTPLVMFFPGKYDKLTLRLFGKTGLSGGAVEDRKRKANYYRAFRLIE